MFITASLWGLACKISGRASFLNALPKHVVCQRFKKVKRANHFTITFSISCIVQFIALWLLTRQRFVTVHGVCY